jgi:alginate O-acetyltransferase complex protein AlgI
MLFNSFSFALFLPIVFAIHWFFIKDKNRNLFLLGASYLFYATWDWRFLFLLLFSTMLDYFSGLQIEKTIRYRKFCLLFSISINLGFLAVFKYYNFFVSSLIEGLHNIGIEANVSLLNIVLPVGISFYTFHGISYLIDIYYKRIKAEKNIISYSLFVCFFPLLVAGPIERANHLLPQINKIRYFYYTKAIQGLKLILWGLFKKIVIADQCAKFVNIIFENQVDASGTTNWIGAVLFSIQIYCDFSGYSDIALGTAKLFGFELLRNFNFPYFSKNIAEFWRKWHISLSSWFRDYVYIPLGGSKASYIKKIRNILIVFLLSGLWHGANWTFVFWGLMHAFFLIVSSQFVSKREIQIVQVENLKTKLISFFLLVKTFVIVTVAWVFFRSETIANAFQYVYKMFQIQAFKAPEIPYNNFDYLFVIYFALFLILEIFGRKMENPIQNLKFLKNRLFRWGFYFFLIFVILFYCGSKEQFIYFQF